MRLQTSLLDRLLDDAPDLAHDRLSTRTEELRAIRDGFRRDLEALLNTRRLCRTPPKAFAALNHALTAYGVEDLVGAPLATLEQRRDLAAEVEKTIKTFEPRLSSVSVTLVRARDTGERRQTLRIEAVARLGHGPEPVVFETALDPATRCFQVD